MVRILPTRTHTHARVALGRDGYVALPKPPDRESATPYYICVREQVPPVARLLQRCSVHAREKKMMEYCVLVLAFFAGAFRFADPGGED